jgi:hypothetical protein
VLNQGLVTVEREPAEVNLVQKTHKEIGALRKNRKMAKAAKTATKKTTKATTPGYKAAAKKLEHVTRADPWAAASVVDVSKWILMAMPTSIMYLNWC